MLIKAHASALMLIDMQEKLLPLVVDAPEIEKNCRWLMQIAHYLNIPMITTEQYPRGLGPTVIGLNEFSDEKNHHEKICFSAASESIISLNRQQWILIGIETHVCVLQTALELQAQGKEVFIVEDCTSARFDKDKQLALDRMRDHGINIVSREMVVFEWLAKAGTPEFKHINENFIK
jgi:nicotinamidase-related amidase